MAIPKKKNRKIKFKYFILKKELKFKINGLINECKKIKKAVRLKYKYKVY